MGIMGDMARRDIGGTGRREDMFSGLYDGDDGMITVVLSGRYRGVRYEVASYYGMYPLARVLYGEGKDGFMDAGTVYVRDSRGTVRRGDVCTPYMMPVRTVMTVTYDSSECGDFVNGTGTRRTPRELENDCRAYIDAIMGE